MYVEKKKKISLTAQIVIASIAGLILGALIGPWMGNIEFIGIIWIRLIQMSIIALVMTSVAGAIGNIEGTGAGKLTFHTFKYIILFTLCSAILGLALSYIFQPGVGITLDASVKTVENQPTEVSVIDTLINFVPTNIFEAMSTGSTIQCIIFALIFGIAAGGYARDSKRDNILILIKDINGVVMRIIGMIMKIAPVGIFCLLLLLLEQPDLVLFCLCLSSYLHFLLVILLCFGLLSSHCPKVWC